MLTKRWYWSAWVREPRLIGDTEVFCIVLCWKIGDRLVLAEEGVEASCNTVASSQLKQFARPQSEMATVEELVQMMNTLQKQHHALNQEISRLTLGNQQLRQTGSPGLAEIATTVGQAVQTSISNANPRSSERQNLVDIKGLGKRPQGNYRGQRSNGWKIKTTSSRTQHLIDSLVR